jgi:hypothetical protein
MLIFDRLAQFDFHFQPSDMGIAGWQKEFHTGWFIESILSASLVVFAYTSAFTSRPSRAMLVMTALVGLVALGLLIPHWQVL